MKEITLSNFPKEKIYILLSENYRKSLIQKSMKRLNCKNYFELSGWINKKYTSKFNGGDIKYWVKGKRLDKRTGKIHPKFMPLWLVLILSKLNKEKIEDLQKNMISYRSGGKGLIINKPKIPLLVSPELDSIVVHLFGDGAAGDFTPSYTQKNKLAFDNFIEKLENCFGNFKKSIYFTQGKYQIKFPKAITDVISNYYSIKSYKSHESEIPLKILISNKLHKLACIVSFIIDEGYVRDVVHLYSSNKKLLTGIKKLILDCHYNCSEIQVNKKAKSYFFTLKNKNIEQFYQDVQSLSKKFPSCNLSFKEEDIKFIIKRRSKKNPKKYKLTDKIILNILKRRKFTAKQISRLTGYAYCTVVHHLKKLYYHRKVERDRKEDSTYLWQLYKK